MSSGEINRAAPPRHASGSSCGSCGSSSSLRHLEKQLQDDCDADFSVPELLADDMDWFDCNSSMGTWTVPTTLMTATSSSEFVDTKNALTLPLPPFVDSMLHEVLHQLDVLSHGRPWKQAFDRDRIVERLRFFHATGIRPSFNVRHYHCHFGNNDLWQHGLVAKLENPFGWYTNLFDQVCRQIVSLSHGRVWKAAFDEDETMVRLKKFHYTGKMPPLLSAESASESALVLDKSDTAGSMTNPQSTPVSLFLSRYLQPETMLDHAAAVVQNHADSSDDSLYQVYMAAGQTDGQSRFDFKDSTAAAAITPSVPRELEIPVLKDGDASQCPDTTTTHPMEVTGLPQPASTVQVHPVGAALIILPERPHTDRCDDWAAADDATLKNVNVLTSTANHSLRIAPVLLPNIVETASTHPPDVSSSQAPSFQPSNTATESEATEASPSAPRVDIDVLFDCLDINDDCQSPTSPRNHKGNRDYHANISRRIEDFLQTDLTKQGRDLIVKQVVKCVTDRGGRFWKAKRLSHDNSSTVTNTTPTAATTTPTTESPDATVNTLWTLVSSRVAASRTELYLSGIDDRDVLMYPGGHTAVHPGHQFYLQLVSQYRDLYKNKSTKDGEKTAIVRHIVSSIQKRGGRCMRKTKDTAAWFELEDKEKSKVVRQALRDKPKRHFSVPIATSVPTRSTVAAARNDSDVGTGSSNTGS